MGKFNPFRKSDAEHDDTDRYRNLDTDRYWNLDADRYWNLDADDDIAELEQIIEELDKAETVAEEERAQDTLYQMGYNAACVGEIVDPQYADDPSYWMGYQDGRGDKDLEESDVDGGSIDRDFRLDKAFNSIEDVHIAVDKIFEERKASYYPIYVDGGTKFQCTVCKFTSSSEMAAANHVRLAHQGNR